MTHAALRVLCKLIVQFAIAHCSDQNVDDQGDFAPYDPPRAKLRVIIRYVWSDRERKRGAGGDASTFASVKDATSFGSGDPPTMTTSRQGEKTSARGHQAR
jgi:hypothetical protein